MADFSHRPVFVVGHDFHEYRHTTGAIAFVGQLFVVVIIATTGATFNRALDGVFFHIGGERLVDDGAQAGIIIGIPPALARGHGQLTNDFGEDLAPLGILCRLAVLDVGPLTVTRHTAPPLNH